MIPNLDPSKLDPKVLMELSTLVQQLPPAQITRMQSLMHNMMAGFDVSREMAEFEKSLPPGFREKLTGLLGAAGDLSAAMSPGSATTMTGAPGPGATIEVPKPLNSVRDARLTILQAVASGSMSPEEAEKILFST